MANEKNLQTSERRPATRGALTLHDAFEKMFNDWLGEAGLGPLWSPATQEVQMPSIDVAETEKEVQVTAELPGMNEKDIEVSLNHDRLIIRGEKKEEQEERKKDYYRKERRFGSVYREVPLPCEVLADKVDATFKQGVLKVTLPKTPAAQRETQKIPIKGA